MEHRRLEFNLQLNYLPQLSEFWQIKHCVLSSPYVKWEYSSLIQALLKELKNNVVPSIVSSIYMLSAQLFIDRLIIRQIQIYIQFKINHLVVCEK